MSSVVIILLVCLWLSEHFSDFPFSPLSFTNLLAFIADMWRLRSHDDATLIMIIDIFCFLFDDCSLLYEWNGRFLELQPVLKSHGLLSDGDSLLDARHAFFHHIANGLCIYSDAVGCHQSYGLSLVQVSYSVYNLPHDTQLMSTHDNPSPLTHALSKAMTDFPHKNKVTKQKLNQQLNYYNHITILRK